MARHLSQFPEVHPYYMETSFLGRDIFAMDLRPPQGGAHVSQATLNAQRPTLYLNAREDGNEVSSTSYVLRLAEQVAAEPEVRTYLDSVGVTVLPVSNPDGAQEAYERQTVNPDFMLHSGYYAALGPSMGAQEDETARGEWLRLQAGAGLSVVTAALRYLYHGTNTVVREAETTEGTLRRWVYREKPVLPPGAGEVDP